MRGLGELALPAVDLYEMKKERLVLHLIGSGEALRLNRSGRRLVPAPEEDETGDRAAEHHALPDSIPDAARQLRGAIGELQRLPVAVERLEGHGEVVVGAERWGWQVVRKRMGERALEQDPAFVEPVPPGEQGGLAGQRLGENLRERECLCELQRELEMRPRLIELAVENEEASQLSGDGCEILVGLVTRERLQRYLQAGDRL